MLPAKKRWSNLNKSNYLYLGIGISYIVIAIIQACIPGVLGANIYVTVAFVSFELTLLELIKSTTNAYCSNCEQYERTRNNYIGLLQRNIAVFKPYSFFDDDTKMFEDKLQTVQGSNKTDKYRKRYCFLKKMVSCLTVFQIVFCSIQIIVTPLKIIPYDLITTKTINVLSLLSFAFMFVSYFISSASNSIDKEEQDKSAIELNVSNYYLDKIKSINEHTKKDVFQDETEVKK